MGLFERLRQSFNRTIVELKLESRGPENISTSNRTIVELKLVKPLANGRPDCDF